MFQASVRRPIQLFVEVKLNGVPILDAKVRVFFEVSYFCSILTTFVIYWNWKYWCLHMNYFFKIINLRCEKINNVLVDLYDNGNGGEQIKLYYQLFKSLIINHRWKISDPDLHSNDGVYSRYLTDLSHGEGRYIATVQVDDNGGRAFSYQKEKSGLNSEKS